MPTPWPHGYTHNDPQDAFAHAIKIGALSTSQTRPNYAGDWMYMHTEQHNQVDAFKHRDTKVYIRLEHERPVSP